MNRIVIIFIILTCCFYGTLAFAGTKLYMDDDLNDYRHPSDNQNTMPTQNYSLETTPSQPLSGKADAEYWCDRMTKANNRLERAQKALIDSGMTAAGVRGTYGRKYIGGSAVADTTIEENRAKDEVRAAQDDLNNIEEEARRKSIPPGWLYCNY
jgi:hypothetical protein